MRRRYHRLVSAGLLLGAFGLAHAASAGELLAVVTDRAGQPVAGAVAYAAPRRDAPVSRAQDAQERPPRDGKLPPRRSASGERTIMDQRGREFVPYVLAVQTGTPVYFPNSDDIRHHVYSFSPAKTFELPLYKDTPAEPVVFDKPGAVALGCNIHDWMIGYVYVVDTPYFAVTAADGRARLALPAGDYELRVWHPRLKGTADATRRTVHIGAGETRAADSKDGGGRAQSGTRAEFDVALNPERRKPRPAQPEYDADDYNY